MSPVQSARMHSHDPWLYLRDALTHLPTYPALEIDTLLPHRWTSSPRGITAYGWSADFRVSLREHRLRPGAVIRRRLLLDVVA